VSKQEPSFYAILPATVRYDKELSSSEKIFYCEITAMSKKEGYCWASNNYFAELYGVSTSTVSSWCSSLKEKGHVVIEYEREGKQVKKRNIYPIQKIDHPYSENLNGGVQKTEGGYSENLKENNTRVNNTSINNEDYEIPNKNDLIKYFKDKGDMIAEDIPLEAENFINHYEEKEWKNSDGKRIKNWRRQAGTWNNNYQKYNRDRLKSENESTPTYHQYL